MPDPIFFPRRGPFTLSEIAERCAIALAPDVDGTISISDVAPIDVAGPGDLTFLDNPKYADRALTSSASACRQSRSRLTKVRCAAASRLQPPM